MVTTQLLSMSLDILFQRSHTVFESRLESEAAGMFTSTATLLLAHLFLMLVELAKEGLISETDSFWSG